MGSDPDLPCPGRSAPVRAGELPNVGAVRIAGVVEEIVVEGWSFNPPPYWPRPPVDWNPSPSWQPDPAWGPVPAGWQLWVRESRGYQRPALAATAGVIALLAIGAIGVLIPRTPVSNSTTGAPAGPNGPAVAVPAQRSGSILLDTDRTIVPAIRDPATYGRTKHGRLAQRYDSCAALNAAYPHGLGLPTAVDDPARTGDTSVTNFGRSTSFYGMNRILDTDADGIACEHS